MASKPFYVMIPQLLALLAKREPFIFDAGNRGDAEVLCAHHIEDGHCFRIEDGRIHVISFPNRRTVMVSSMGEARAAAVEMASRGFPVVTTARRQGGYRVTGERVKGAA